MSPGEVCRRSGACSASWGDLPFAGIADRFLAVETEEKVWFVSVQIFFSDGTSSDVRVFENPYADL